MKRSGIRRTSGLKPDPEQVRAWQRKTQARARERREEGQQAPVAPEGEQTLAWALRAPFKARTPARRHRCVRCGRTAHHWHHLLGQQHLRVWARGVAQRERLAPSEVRSRLKAVLRDERNLVAACQGCHLQSEHGADDKPLVSPAPDEAMNFAAELGPEWVARLERACS